MATYGIAQWLATGSGPAGGQFDSSLGTVSVSALPAPGLKCVPGADCDATFQIDSPQAMTLLSATANGTDTGFTSACPASNITMSTGAASLNQPVQQGAHNYTFRILHAASATPDACKSVVFTKGLTLSLSP
jgi:hypothetical protein